MWGKQREEKTEETRKEGDNNGFAICVKGAFEKLRFGGLKTMIVVNR